MRKAVRMYAEKFPDRNRASLFRLCNVLDYLSMFKDDMLNICTSSENVAVRNNMFVEYFKIMCFL